MNGKKAKKLRQLARELSGGQPRNSDYQHLKRIYRSLTAPERSSPDRVGVAS